MADSPPRSDAPDSVSGDDLTVPRAVEDAVPPEQQDGAGPPEPADRFQQDPRTELPPWGASQPWWSPGTGDGTGPQIVAGGTGPHVLPGPANGTGPHVLPHGTGPLPAAALPEPAAPAAAGGRKRLSAPLLGAGAAAVLVVALAGVLVLRQVNGENARTAAVPASKKRITAVAVAGGLRKEPAAAVPASAAYPFVAAPVRAGGVPVGGEGVYAEEPKGPLNVLFMGGTGPVGDTAAFLRKIRPTTFIAVQGTAAGKGGGRALCGSFAVLAEIHLYCAWATEDSYGVVASNVPAPAWRLPAMAELMRGIRRDVEGPRR
ncbi:hypothetical protein AGRA3207_001720 [Actinomadura graeca]|uniref:Uncharacterized protein n=1 Tax=Actinomadura graeca TaxID=2750812 RepID=A0ABX8QQ50_9ACTN|nr:hypothetical protein [Actinomadura graeca]QXJ20923.1 hypothetical protein AGRA3207_001720 [Actinomadura graeca]